MNLKSHLFIYFCLFFRLSSPTMTLATYVQPYSQWNPSCCKGEILVKRSRNNLLRLWLLGDTLFSSLPGSMCTKGNPHSGILVKSRILDFVIWNVAQGVCNPANNWNPNSNLNRKGIRNPLLWMQNPWRGILNPRLSWIPLHEANIIADIWAKRRRN